MKSPRSSTSVTAAQRLANGKELAPREARPDGEPGDRERFYNIASGPRPGKRMEGERESRLTFLIGRSAAANAAAAGFIATMIATVSGLWFPGVKLPQFDFNALNGRLAFGDVSFPLARDVWVIGGIIHMIDGVIWAVIFGLVVSPVLGVVFRPLRAMTPTTNLVKGLIWGATLWVISSAFWMPLLIGNLLGPVFTGGFGLSCGVGPFLTCFGPYGVQALFTNLFWHMIWGVNLGLLFNPMRAR
jgi:hypothetical protein